MTEEQEKESRPLELQVENLNRHVFGWPSLAYLNLMNTVLIAMLMAIGGCRDIETKARLDRIEKALKSAEQTRP